MSESLTLVKPDDWHIHLRDGAVLKHTVSDVATQFKRAIVMPNLVPPVTNADQALSYKQRILEARAENSDFEPLMVLYLTDLTSPTIIEQASNAGITACKLYPAGATTNSDSGVTDIKNIYPALEKMAECDMPLLIHGEVTDSHVDIFDREKIFIEDILIPLCQRFPELKVVLEHITTKQAVEFVKSSRENTGATITAHHLLFNRNAMLAGGIRPHYYCLPILKRSLHQQALIEAATSGDNRFFLGTDSAPHARNKKEAACGCAGCYTAFAALPFYATVFEHAGALDKLEAFASFNGPDFYGLPRNTGTITLVKQNWKIPELLPFGDTELAPLMAGQTLDWKIQL